MLSSLEDILERLTRARENKLKPEAIEETCLDELAALVESGQITAEESLTWNDWTISQRRKKSYRYPAHISEQRDALKAAERLSVALGEAEVNTTTFWVLKQQKP